MSAPNQGRQSPDPEHQTGDQLQSHPAEPGTAKIDNSEAKNEGKENQTAGLSSNPKPPLEEFVKEKFEKKV